MYNSSTVIWVLVAAFLVYFMQAGFALCEAGLTRAKNTGNILMKNLMDFCIGTPCFWLFGFGAMFGLGTGLFGGEGFIMQRLSGSGVAFAEIDGELVEYELREGQQIVADTGNVAGFTAGVKMEIQQVPGMKNKLLGGEGLFNTLLTGPGRVWLQTMPISSVAASIRPYIPTGNG